MIQTLDKANCCGCSACFSACPKHCITMNKDEEGFLYPKVDLSLCIDCGLCEKVCPIINKGSTQKPQITLAAFNKDEETRRASSSGGVFSLLAQKVIDADGIVFGARYNDDLSVSHDFTDTILGLRAFRGSKYLQSNMLDNFGKVKRFLDDGRKVLFSGTSCQIAGLNRYLQKPYPNLITIDCVCHGVPSPSIWKSYISEIGIKPIKVIFRDKRNGWKNYQVTIIGKNQKNQSEVFWENPYMQTFLSNLNLRPSCYNCPSKGGSSYSDITLGDFWGIEHIDPNVDDDKGTSLVLINTPKGEKLFSGLDVEFKEESYEDAVKYNPSIEVSVTEPEARAKFFRIFSQSGFNAAYKATIIPPISRRVINRLKRMIGCQLDDNSKKIIHFFRGK